MKQKLLLLILLLFSITSFSQSKFTNGFRDGYKEGYCHNQGIGCLSPNPPIAPNPKIGESLNSYQDGYNRGFEQGLSAQKTNSNNNQTRERYKTAEPKFVDDFVYQPNYDLILKVLEQKQRQSSRSTYKNYSASDYSKNLEKAKNILLCIDVSKDYLKKIDNGAKYSNNILLILNRYENEIQSMEYEYQIANNTQYFDQVDKNVKKINFLLSSESTLQSFRNQEYENVILVLRPYVRFIKEGKITDKVEIFFVYELLAYSYYHYNNFNQAEEFATKAIDNAITKQIGDLYFLRSMARSKIQLYRDSNSDLDYLINNYQFINYEADLATLYNNKAYNFLLLKQYDDARPLIEKALSLNQNLNYIWDTKGELEYHLDNYSETVKAMTNAIKLKESDNSYYYRGLANIKLGNKTEGCKDLSKAGELGESKALYEAKKNCMDKRFE